MADERIPRCLQLCRQASSESGEVQQQALAELERALTTLEREPLALTSETLPLYARMLQQLREPIITMDLSGYVTGWNKGSEALFGYSKEEALGQNILFLCADEPGEEEIGMPASFLDQGNSFMEVRRRKKSGEIFWAGLSLALVSDDEGEPAGLVAHLSEITERLMMEENLRLNARIIEDSDQGVLIIDTNERIVSVNAAFTRITGYTAEEAVGQTPDILRSGVHDADFREQVRGAMQGICSWQGEIIGKHKDGKLFPQAVSISVVRNENGKITHAFSIFSDISALRETEDRMQQLTNYDTLTGLPNRSLLYQLVTQALTLARRNDSYGVLLVIGLSRFAAISNALGYGVGDELLRQVGQRFRAALRDEDVLSRVADDEFVAALLDIQKREHGGIVAQKLLSALDSPFCIDGHELYVGASIGISVYPEDGLETDTLIRFADVAMKRVQSNGETGYLFYSTDMDQRAKEHLRLESDLRTALVNCQLELYYQPKVSLRSGRIVGAEALIRWRHPEHGMISPVKFIPVAEETGLILDIGTWVLEEACRQVRQWLDEGLDVQPVAVNLSARQFDHQLPERVQGVLNRHGIDPSLIKLEITESMLVRGAENVIQIMNSLVAMGMALALDDFGTGYSSLSYLKKFPISTLKIDRSFVIGVPVDENDCAIARAIVTMGQQMRQEIVAEGVETIEQMIFLRDLGCDQLQGYLFSPPVTSGEFARMLREKHQLSLP